jgi:hypothetical protein
MNPNIPINNNKFLHFREMSQLLIIAIYFFSPLLPMPMMTSEEGTSIYEYRSFLGGINNYNREER